MPEKDMNEELIRSWKALIDTYGPYEVLLTYEQIQQRVDELAEEIYNDYKDKVSVEKPLVVICVLTGAVFFFSHLIKRLNLPVVTEFLDVSSYAGRKSTGVVKITKDVDFDVTDQHVLIVEDIVDTGLTLNYLLEFFKPRNPRSIKTCVLLDKEECRKVPLKADYIGFKIPNKFLVGYGLDYDEYLRNVPFVYAFK